MKHLLLFVALFFPILVVYTQQKDRPKIGLVLSGGGAKGFAHIGVLEIFEKEDLENIEKKLTDSSNERIADEKEQSLLAESKKNLLKDKSI